MQTSSSPHASSPQPCTMCGKPAPDLCKQCNSSQYCSRACQRSDWPVHKLLCSSFSNFLTPPDASYKRCIFFPVSGTKPEFVWVHCSWHTDDDDGISYQLFDKTPFMGEGMTNTVWVQRNNTRARARTDALFVYVREAGSIDGSLLNKSVIAAARGRYVNLAWPGPLLVVRSLGLTLGDSQLVDTDMVDFRDAIDVLCSYPDVNINFVAPEATWEVDAVRVNCAGEMKLYERPKFEAVKIPADHVALSQPVLGVSTLLGFAVRVVKCSPNKNTKGYDLKNREASFLYLDRDPKSAGWALMEGNVLVVREDRGTLRKQHVAVLCQYCLDVLQPLFEKWRAGRVPKQRMMDMMTKRAFGEYWTVYDARNRADGLEWETVESPV